MAAKAYFAAIPLRAIGDRSLTDGDLRVLASIAAFDRLSHSTGKGQGAWASHRLMSGWIDRNYSNFSATVTKLIRLGYLVREPRETDKRQHTYRIVYTGDDRLPKSGELVSPGANNVVCSTANEDGEIVCPETGELQKVVCPAPHPSHGNFVETSPEYIPQSGERYSVETGERNSGNRRDLKIAERPAGIFCQLRPGFNDLPMGARVSKVETAFDAINRDPFAMPDDERHKLSEWLFWVMDTYADESFGQQAQRLLGEIDQ